MNQKPIPADDWKGGDSRSKASFAVGLTTPVIKTGGKMSKPNNSKTLRDPKPILEFVPKKREGEPTKKKARSDNAETVARVRELQSKDVIRCDFCHAIVKTTKLFSHTMKKHGAKTKSSLGHPLKTAKKKVNRFYHLEQAGLPSLGKKR